MFDLVFRSNNDIQAPPGATTLSWRTHTMATDYDAPRRRMDDEIETDSLEGLKAAEVAGSSMDDDGAVSYTHLTLPTTPYV